MAISAAILAGLREDYDLDSGTQIKRGEEIFVGTDYPRDWDGFVGQRDLKDELQVRVASARARGTRLDHTLLASGLHGVGKSTIATLLAYQLDAGLVQASGQLDVDDARELMEGMEDGDVLFIDEAHMLVQGNRTRADWLLPWMLEGKLYTKRGAEPTPDITLICATTDAGKLPQTLLSRFPLTPEFVPYTDDEGGQIAATLAARMEVPEISDVAAKEIAIAADNNPRAMRKILTGVRDLAHAPAYRETHPNLPKAMEWAGVSPDGLTRTAREILVQLFIAADYTLGNESLRARLNEPGPIKHDEQQLLQRNLIDITGRGRKLTDAGVRRARLEAQILTSKVM